MDCPWCGVISRGTTIMEGVSSLLLLPQRVAETLIRCSVSVLLPEPLPPPYHLREVQVTILNDSRCHELFRSPSLHPFISSDVFCAGAEDGSADTCSVSVPPLPLRGSPPCLTQDLRALSTSAVNLSAGFTHANHLQPRTTQPKNVPLIFYSRYFSPSLSPSEVEAMALLS